MEFKEIFTPKFVDIQEYGYNLKETYETLYTSENDCYIDLIDYDLKLLLVSYLLFIVESEFYIEQNKFCFAMFDRESFSPYEEFIKIRSSYYNSIANKESLCLFLSKNVNFSCNTNEVQLLISRFSVFDEAISYKDFIKASLPFEMLD